MTRLSVVIHFILFALLGCNTLPKKTETQTISDPDELTAPLVVYYKSGLAPDELRKKISGRRYLTAGQDVRVTTVDGQVHEFNYQRVEEGQMVGDRTIVAIDHIVALETYLDNREFAELTPGEKTANVAGGAIWGYCFST